MSFRFPSTKIRIYKTYTYLLLLSIDYKYVLHVILAITLGIK